MKHQDEAKKAVGILAASVKLPPPPEGLGAGRRPTLRPGSVLLAGALVLVVLLAGWLLRKEDTPATPRVVVEHLRLRGKPVPTQVLEFPGTDTLLVMVAEENRDIAGQDAVEGVLAVACMISQGRLDP